MKKHKNIIAQIPEYYLIILSLIACYTLPYTIKIIAIVIAVILTLQIIFKNKTIGHIIASLFLIGNLAMLFALTSDLNEFPRFNANANELLLGGFLLFGFNLYISGLMLFKYPLRGLNHKLQTES